LRPSTNDGVPVNAQRWQLLRHGLLWHRPESFRRSVAYVLILIVASVAVQRRAWSVDGASMPDGHAIVSLDLAIARA